MCNTFFDFLSCTLIHICHRTANTLSVPVNKNKSLHSGAKADALNLLFFYLFALFEHFLCGNAHCIPPLVSILLASALYSCFVVYIKLVALGSGAKDFDFVVDFDKTGFDACCTDVIGDYVLAHIFLRM